MSKLSKEKRTVIYITGMSGTGKSTALERLSQRGYQVIDTDSDEWSVWVHDTDDSMDWILREDVLTTYLNNHKEGALFIAGCKTNQGTFYSYFDHVVLLSAPTHLLQERIQNRTNNDYGKRPEEWEAILGYIDEVEPLLRKSATIAIDTSVPIETVVGQLEQLINKGE